MKRFLLVLVLFAVAFGVNKATKPYNFTSHTTALSDQVNKDMDSIYVPFNKAVDSANKYNKMLRGDSTIAHLIVDTITGNTVIDSISGVDNVSGNPKIDSIKEIDCIRGNPDIDSISGLNVIRGNPDIDSICGHPVIDSIKFGNSQSYLSEYIDTTFYDSLYDGTTYRNRVLARIVKIGAIITLYQPIISGAITISTQTTIKGIPSKFYPTVSGMVVVYCPIKLLIGGSVVASGVLAFVANNFVIQTEDGSTLSAGTHSILEQNVTWTK